LTARLERALSEVAQLEAEVARLNLVATNANIAVQAQTASLQQYLVAGEAPHAR
jgi:hypothetical protein